MKPRANGGVVVYGSAASLEDQLGIADPETAVDWPGPHGLDEELLLGGNVGHRAQHADVGHAHGGRVGPG